REFLHQIVPLYRRLQDCGQIEVSISPFYHPILPLLCDTGEASVAMPDAHLPSPGFSHPDDARQQIERSIRFYRDRFGSSPHGMWPSEGSVSPAVVRLAAEAGLSWIATDDAILSQSLHPPRQGTDDGKHLSPAQRYRAYKAKSGNQEIAIVFRDHLLSDHIGFVYSRWDPIDAAEDMIQRLLEIRRQVPENVSTVVPVILDGENAWEYYADHGRPFLRALYSKLSDTPEIKTVTMQTATAANRLDPIERLHSGSWIDGNYGTWIGHPEKNAGWECLQKAREMLTAREALNDRRDAEAIRNARESLYIAEGSDWFWWYGDDHMSENDAQFDQLFRKHVANIYRSLGEPIPARLEKSIREPHLVTPTRTPVGPITPSLDGKRSDYYEWLPAGYFDVHGGKGSMHQSDTFLKRIHFGFNRSHLHLRIDTAVPLAEFNGHATQIHLRFYEPSSHSLSISPGSNGIYGMGMDGKASDSSHVGVGRLVELSVSFEQLEVTPGEMLVFEIEVLTGTSVLEQWPASGTVSIEVPDPHNNDNWVV
ncbi:MAG: glycoside hydrolase, partial [Candidatus Latescibacteria bacterium]|nr:glycoside hydrolase [Candidatus Latescibacterota bacterium]